MKNLIISQNLDSQKHSFYNFGLFLSIQIINANITQLCVVWISQRLWPRVHQIDPQLIHHRDHHHILRVTSIYINPSVLDYSIVPYPGYFEHHHSTQMIHIPHVFAPMLSPSGYLEWDNNRKRNWTCRFKDAMMKQEKKEKKESWNS